MKLSEKIFGEALKLPKFNADDTFRQKFVKYARWLGKSFPDDMSDVNTINFCYDRLESLLPILKSFTSNEFSGYVGEPFSEAKFEFDVDSNVAIKNVLNKFSGASFYDDAVVFYNPDTIQSGGEIIVILSECSAVKDGSVYSVRSRNRTVRFMSIGYLILASELVEKVVSKYPEQARENAVFDWQNKHWDSSSPVELYDEELRLLLNKEMASTVDFKKHVQGRKIPTVCRDKKVQDLKMNQSTIFNQLGFRKVEVDTETYKGKEFNYKAFHQLESDFQSIYSKLPKPNVQAELRFRNLNGKNGVYYELFNTIIIDREDFSPFIHEYAHYVDYKHGKEQYSFTKDFSHIVSNYRKAYMDKLEKEDFSTSCHYKRKKKYYLSKVEIFARAFELWVSHTIITDTPLLKTKEDYKNEFCYKIFGGFMEEVIYYFNNLFGTSENQAFASKTVKVVESLDSTQ